MHTIKNRRVHTIVLGIIGLVLMVLFSACAVFPATAALAQAIKSPVKCRLPVPPAIA